MHIQVLQGPSFQALQLRGRAHWAGRLFFIDLDLTLVPVEEALRVVAMATDGLDNISDGTFSADGAGIITIAETRWRLNFEPMLRAGRFADGLDRHIHGCCDVVCELLICEGSYVCIAGQSYCVKFSEC